MVNSPNAQSKSNFRGAFKIVVTAVACGAAGLLIGVHQYQRLAPLIGETTGIASAPGGAVASGETLWTCSMHPQVLQETPGMCPICHMQLTPVKSDDAGAPSETTHEYSAGMVVTVDPTVVQNMGIRTERVHVGPLVRTIRAVGILEPAQPLIHDINLRVMGWVRKLHANVEGMFVKRGAPLFELYSPELQTAVDELIAARAEQDVQTGSPEQAARLARNLMNASVRKLERYGLDDTQIEALASMAHAPEAVTFYAPISGYVTENMIVEGAAIEPGARAMRIVDLSTLWLDARIYEQDIPYIHMGQTVTATVESRPGAPVEGDIMFLHPEVDPMTRTVMARIRVANPTGELRPGMYATMALVAELPEPTVIAPREAVIDTGVRQVAFVAEADGKFSPRTVRMGASGDHGAVQILEGLEAGDLVVTSGQFLLDTESRLREAVRKFRTERGPALELAAHTDHAEPEADEVRGPLTATAKNALDTLVTSYLEVADYLGALPGTEPAVDMNKLVRSARTFASAVEGTPNAALAQSIAASAEAMSRQKVPRQRDLFKPLSDAVVKLVRRHAPSAKVAAELRVLYCSMAPGHWLQTRPGLANPFYGDEMKLCGELITIVRGDQ